MKYDETMYIYTLIHLFTSCKQYSMPTELKSKTWFIGEFIIIIIIAFILGSMAHSITVAQLQNSIFQAYWDYIGMISASVSSDSIGAIEMLYYYYH